MIPAPKLLPLLFPQYHAIPEVMIIDNEEIDEDDCDDNCDNDDDDHYAGDDVCNEDDDDDDDDDGYDNYNKIYHHQHQSLLKLSVC